MTKARQFATPAVEDVAARLVGIHAATVCPMREDFGIDETALARHVEMVAGKPGIRGLLINGHAGENAQLTGDEKRRVISVVRGATAHTTFLTTGVYSESTIEAVRHAEDAEQEGADAILLFPPNGWAVGQDAEAVVAHHQAVASATRLPLLLYQAPVHAGHLAYPPTTLRRLLSISSVVGIKEGSWEIAAYEEVRRLAKTIRSELSVLASGDEHLLVGYIIGTEGSQVSLAAVIPDRIVDLWEAAAKGDWTTARAIHERIYPLAVSIYRNAPASRATARLKACLQILGLADNAVARPPTQPLDRAERKAIESALDFANA